MPREGSTTDLRKRHQQMIYPAVRMIAGSHGGSGTVVYSQKQANGQARTIVLGCHHVIESLIKVKEEWDPRIGRNRKKETRATAQCEVFHYNAWSRCVGTTSVESDVVAYDADHDMALLETRDRENALAYSAHLVLKSRIDTILLGSRLCAVGAALLHPPILTEGVLNFKDDEIEQKKYWMSSAQIIFGNSGGAMYWHDGFDYWLLGIPSRIAISGSLWAMDAITHMGYFSPPDRVYEFLEENDYQFIYDSAQTPEECDKRRDEKREADRKRVEMLEGLVQR